MNHTPVSFLYVRRDHPHIVHLVDYFWEPDRGYIVMEMCEGGDLLDRIIAKVRVYPSCDSFNTSFFCRFLPSSRARASLQCRGELGIEM